MVISVVKINKMSRQYIYHDNFKLNMTIFNLLFYFIIVLLYTNSEPEKDRNTLIKQSGNYILGLGVLQTFKHLCMVNKENQDTFNGPISHRFHFNAVLCQCVILFPHRIVEMFSRRLQSKSLRVWLIT